MSTIQPIVNGGFDGEASEVASPIPPESRPAVEQIKEEHRLAQLHRDDAIRHAIHCGQLLLAEKKSLLHGAFMTWVTGTCGLPYSTAARYMKAARQSSTGVEISSLSRLFPSGRSEKSTGMSAETIAAEHAIASSERARIKREDKAKVRRAIAAPNLVSGTIAEEPIEHRELVVAAQAAELSEIPSPATNITGSALVSAGRDVDRDRVKATITDYATKCGWGAAAMDLVPWIEERYQAEARS